MTPLPHTDTYQPVLLQGRYLAWVRFAEEQAVASGRYVHAAGVAVLHHHREGVAVIHHHREGVGR